MRNISSVIIAMFGLIYSSLPAQAEPWTATGDNGRPRVAIAKTAEDGATVFHGGCNKTLGRGISGTFESYTGDALHRVDDTSESVTFDIETALGVQSFQAQLHYFAPDRAWVTSELLPVSFVDAFGTGLRMVVRNGDGVPVFSFDLTGSGKAAQLMKKVCGL